MREFIVFHFISGEAFFSGSLFILVSLFTPVTKLSRRGKAGVAVLMTIGFLFIVQSSTPLPIWFYVILGVMMLLWRKSLDKGFISWKATTALKVSIFVFVGLGVFSELPYLRRPIIPVTSSKTIYVIGDSISAGLGTKGETTWPQILARNPGINVVNLAQAGATVNSALEQAEKVPVGSQIVLLEIRRKRSVFYLKGPISIGFGKTP